MKSFKTLALIAFFTFQFVSANSQGSPVNAGVIAGLNFSELEGGGITDYFGLNAGLIGTVRIARHSQVADLFLKAVLTAQLAFPFLKSSQANHFWQKTSLFSEKSKKKVRPSFICSRSLELFFLESIFSKKWKTPTKILNPISPPIIIR